MLKVIMTRISIYMSLLLLSLLCWYYVIALGNWIAKNWGLIQYKIGGVL
jgi:hypothetical protein